MEMRATYRVQFRGGMTFDRAAGIVPYLARLGISHLYASPIFAATAGSTHGYDVTDHTRFDPALGGEAGFIRLSDALKRHGIGLLLDIVPNHMAASTENPWWDSVLEWGAESPYAHHFDIDWTAPALTLPFLGADFADCLANGELALGVGDDGRLVLTYYENAWPLGPHSYPLVLDSLNDERFLPIRNATAAARADTAAAFHEEVKRLGRERDLASALEATRDDAALIGRVHEAQAWRLGNWQDGRRHLTYRRFFEITGLVGVRVEDEPVFDAVHGLVFDLIENGRVDGLRIDHVDGLADPAGYLARLRARVGADVPILVEKILEADEALPPEWPVEGTTGYEFIAALAGLFTDSEKAGALDRAYERTLGSPEDFEKERATAKTGIITWNLEGELTGLRRRATALADALPEVGGFSEDDIEHALIAVMRAFPVYRTYATQNGVRESDRAILSGVEATLAGLPDAHRKAVAFIARLIGLDVPDAVRGDALAFAVRFQQTTGPVMAKAVEDTLFFRTSRLIALNEVGGDPQARADEPAAFHAAMETRLQTQPSGLSATATHDTKRGEDARARLYAISEAPDVWSAAVERWRAMHAGWRSDRPGGAVPDAQTEWMLYQALLGAWPFATAAEFMDAPEKRESFADRFLAFVEKAMREDKRHTRWTAVDTGYEAAVFGYARRLVDADNAAFLTDFAETIAPFVRAGRLTGLAQTLVKLTAPGVPDIYNGTENADLSFVDPDNRRPVDFAALSRSLDDAPEALDKQHLIAAGLQARWDNPNLFAEGSYKPIAVSGPAARCLAAFVRRHEKSTLVVVVPRLCLALDKPGAQGQVDLKKLERTHLTLPDDVQTMAFTEVLSGRRVGGADLKDAETVFSRVPVGFFLSS